MKVSSGLLLILSSAFLLHQLISRGVTHPGRTVTVWERGVRRGESASRPDQSELGRHGETETGRSPWFHQSPRRRVSSIFFLGPVAQRKQSVCLLNRMSQVRFLPGPQVRCGVAQAGKSVRLINERVRVRIPPPRPNRKDEGGRMKYWCATKASRLRESIFFHPFIL